jgi:hypothetical protein
VSEDIQRLKPVDLEVDGVVLSYPNLWNSHSKSRQKEVVESRLSAWGHPYRERYIRA